MILAQLKAALGSLDRVGARGQAGRLRQFGGGLHRPAQGRQRRVGADGSTCSARPAPCAARSACRCCRWAPRSKWTRSSRFTRIDRCRRRRRGPAGSRGGPTRIAGCMARACRKTRSPPPPRRSTPGSASNATSSCSRDGEALVFHDWELDRLTGERGPVAERTAADARRRSLLTGGDGRIPTPASVPRPRGRAGAAADRDQGQAPDRSACRCAVRCGAASKATSARSRS